MKTLQCKTVFVWCFEPQQGIALSEQFWGKKQSHNRKAALRRTLRYVGGQSCLWSEVPRVQNSDRLGFLDYFPWYLLDSESFSFCEWWLDAAHPVVLCIRRYQWAGVAQSVLRLATGWTVRESNPGGGEIFRTRPDLLCGAPSLLYGPHTF